MKKIIHHLRKQSEADRRHVLHITITIIGIIMILLWSLSLGKSIANPKTKTRIKEDLKPFSVLKEGMVGGIGNIKGENTSPTE